MRNLIFTGVHNGERITIEQIQKRTAKKLFDAGEDIYIQTSNFDPFGAWSSCVVINNKEGRAFSDIVNNFEYYNCNSETGYYTTFYKKIY